MAEPARELPAEAQAALMQGRTIDAIKIVRAEHGLDLKDSKDVVDAYLRDHPETRARAEAARAESQPALALVGAALAVAGLLLFLLLRRG